MSDKPSSERPAPRSMQQKRLRWRYGLNPTQARLVASLHYEATSLG